MAEDSHSEVFSVALDREDNIVVTGSFAGTIDFGHGALASHGHLDFFVARYTPDGELLWAISHGGVEAARLGGGY